MAVIVHKDDARDDHKYVARIKVKSKNGKKNKWRYFYTLDEYRAYLKSKKNTVEDKASDLVSKGANALNKVLKKADKAFDKKVAKSKKTVDKILKKTNTSLSDNISKGKKAVDKIAKKASKISTKDIEKGRKAVAKFAKKASKISTKDIEKGKKAVAKFTKKADKFVDENISKAKKAVDKTIKSYSDKTKKSPVKLDAKKVTKGKEFVNKNKEVGFVAFIHKDTISKAVKFVGDLFDKLTDKVTEVKNKIEEPDNYKHKIKMPNGEYEYFADDDEYEDYLERLDYQKNEPSFMKKIKDISHNEAFSKLEDMFQINETYDPYNSRTSENCGNCSAAYELRRRGYDVEAKANGGTGEYNGRSDRVFDYFEDAKLIGICGDGSTVNQDEKLTRKLCDGKLTTKEAKKKGGKDYLSFLTESQSYSAKSIEKAILANNPPGSRGFIDVEWNNGSGHSIVYEVNKQGKVTIRDSQTYDEYSLDELAHSVQRVSIARTDNLQLKENILNTVVTNKDEERRYYVDKGYAQQYYKK